MVRVHSEAWPGTVLSGRHEAVKLRIENMGAGNLALK